MPPQCDRSWTIRPHSSLQAVTAAVTTVTGALRMPLATLERRMTVVRLPDARLIIYSAIALADAELRELESVGRPAFLVVPNHLHRLDALAWKGRYPTLCVVAPPGARSSVEEVVPVDTTTPDFGTPSVRFVVVQGTGEREAALEVDEAGATTLILNDIVGNLPTSHGLVLRAMGFATPRPRIPRAVKVALIQNRRALSQQLEQWSTRPIARILVSHGSPILEDAPAVLRELAHSLR